MSTFITTSYKRVWVLFAISLFLMAPLANQAQTNQQSKSKLLKGLNKPAEKPDYKIHLHQTTNEIEATVAVLFLGYKSFFSSQDMNSCVFSPSCSAFALQAFQKKNPIKAYLMTFDRLTRCHPLGKPGQYPITDNFLLYDPVL